VCYTEYTLYYRHVTNEITTLLLGNKNVLFQSFLMLNVLTTFDVNGLKLYKEL